MTKNQDESRGVLKYTVTVRQVTEEPEKESAKKRIDLTDVACHVYFLPSSLMYILACTLMLIQSMAALLILLPFNPKEAGMTFKEIIKMYLEKLKQVR